MPSSMWFMFSMENGVPSWLIETGAFVRKTMFPDLSVSINLFNPEPERGCQSVFSYAMTNNKGGKIMLTIRIYILSMYIRC